MKHAVIAAALLLFPAATRAATYATDDGVYTDDIGLGLPGLLLNSYASILGSGTIVSIDIAFSPQSVPSTGFSIILFSDPDGNGNPSDGIEHARASATVPETFATGAFHTFAFEQPVTIAAGEGFFTGLYAASGSSVYIGRDALGGESSWAVYSGDDLTAPGTTVVTTASFGLPGDLMIRANAVPEPSSSALTGITAALLCLRRKKS